MSEPVFIEQRTAFEFQVHNLLRNEDIYLQVENFDVRIKRTDVGIVVEIYDMDDPYREEALSSTFAFDTDTESFQGDA